MSRFTLARWLCVPMIVCLSAALAAQEAAEESPPDPLDAPGQTAEQQLADAETVELSAEAIDELIEQLDADRFTQRQKASHALSQAGAAAVPALAKAAQGDRREAASRAFEILEKHWQGGDAALRDAAKTALDQIAGGDNEAAAARAQEILNPKPIPQPAQNLPLFRGLRIRPGQIQPGQIQIQVQGGIGGANRHVRTKITNGVKEINAEENGKKIYIHDDPDNGIKVEVTETKDGKEVTQKYSAKNADELKQKHPDAHKIYQEYAQQPAGIQIQGIQIQAGNAIPLQLQGLPVPNARRLESRQEIADRLAKAIEQIDENIQRIRKAADASGDEELKRAISELEDSKQRVHEAKDRLVP